MAAEGAPCAMSWRRSVRAAIDGAGAARGAGRLPAVIPCPLPSPSPVRSRGRGGAMEMKKRINLELRNQAPEEVSGAGVRPRSHRGHPGPTPVPGRTAAAAPPNLGQRWRRSSAGRGRRFRAPLRAVPRGLEVRGGAGGAFGAFTDLGFSFLSESPRSPCGSQLEREVTGAPSPPSAAARIPPD